MGKKVWLDAGHGGKDAGACANGLREKDINLVATLECKNVLVSHGLVVGMTRTTDVFYELNERCRMANNWGADAFVSIHTNAGGGDGAEAIHSIHYGTGTVLAKNIVAAIKEYTPQNLRPNPTYSKVNSSGNADYFAVIRNTNMSATIVEMGFIDSVDHKVIDTVEEQKVMGRAIAYGILKTFGITFNVSNSNPIPPSNDDISQEQSYEGFYESSEKRTNATIVGQGNIEVLDKNCKVIPNRYISSLDKVFVVGIYPSSNFIEVVYPSGSKKYHAYIDIKHYSRISFDHHMEYQNDNATTYVWWSSGNVNKTNHNEELKPKQKASPMYRTDNWLRVTFYRENGVPSDGYVRFEGEQKENFYTGVPKTQYGIVVNVSSYLNVRDSKGNSIGKVYPKERVEILWTEVGKYYIQYDTPNGKKEGYVSANFIKII